MIDQPREDQWIMSSVVGLDEPFTRSNGTVMARLYERLTKTSRRRVKPPVIAGGFDWQRAREEKAYRQGVYDAYKALQDELS